MVADTLHKFSSFKRWSITQHNPRHNAIASLRWQIKQQTHEYHDQELMVILNAVFRAALVDFDVDAAYLTKVLNREESTRRVGRKRLK
jgi:hypothetical protein